MSEVRTDEEQAELVKKWWRENGTSLIATVAIAAAGFFGWNAYQDNTQAKGESASALYSQLIELSVQQDDSLKTQIQTMAEELKEDYSGTAYANFAGFHIASIAADAGDYEAAAVELKSLMESAKSDALKTIAQARLANVLVQLDKTDEALALIPETPDPAFAPQLEEARGDALYRKGELASAREAYIKALEAAQALGQNKQLLQRKVDSLNMGGDV